MPDNEEAQRMLKGKKTIVDKLCDVLDSTLTDMMDTYAYQRWSIPLLELFREKLESEVFNIRV